MFTVFSRTVISDNRHYDVHLITKMTPYFSQHRFLI